MFKKHFKITLLTLIFSTQLAFNTFSMNVDDDPSRQSISTRQGRGGTIDLTLQHQIEGQNIQQPFNPSHIPPHPKVTRQQHGGTLNPTLQYQIEGQALLNQQQTNQGMGRGALVSLQPSTPWDEGDPLFQPFDFSPVNVAKENRDYRRGIEHNTRKGADLSSSDEESEY